MLVKDGVSLYPLPTLSFLSAAHVPLFLSLLSVLFPDLHKVTVYNNLPHCYFALWCLSLLVSTSRAQKSAFCGILRIEGEQFVEQKVLCCGMPSTFNLPFAFTKNVEEDLALDDQQRNGGFLSDRATSGSVAVLTSASPMSEQQNETPELTADFSASLATTASNLDDLRAAILPVPSFEDVARPVPSILGQLLTPKAAASPQQQRRMRAVCVFCNFLCPRKRTSFSIRIREGSIGMDVVEATVKAFLADKKFQVWSSNPNDYRLYVADEQTGEEETPIAVDGPCGNFMHMALVAQPQALLTLFPDHTQLLPSPAEDVSLVVEVVGARTSKRTVLLPPDLAVEALPEVLKLKLSARDLVEGSLRIKYGPVAVSINQPYNFGAGCGNAGVQVKDRTVLSLHRFGVKEVSVEGTLEDGAPDDEGDGAKAVPAVALFKKMDEEEARAYQQFEVHKVNRYGVSQARVIGVDGERIYNMKPSSELGKTKNPERNIADIEVIRPGTDPTYLEVEYKKTRRYDTDRIYCRNATACSMLLEKLRVLKKLHDRQTQEHEKSETKLTRLMSKFGFGSK